MDEWRNLLRSYEPPQYSAHFSKEGAKSFFADSLDNFLLSPVEDYVAASKAAAVRPKIFPDLDYFDGLVIMLNTDRQEYPPESFWWETPRSTPTTCSAATRRRIRRAKMPAIIRIARVVICHVVTARCAARLANIITFAPVKRDKKRNTRQCALNACRRP